jgi:hypothetical protein
MQPTMEPSIHMQPTNVPPTHVPDNTRQHSPKGWHGWLNHKAGVMSPDTSERTLQRHCICSHHNLGHYMKYSPAAPVLSACTALAPPTHAAVKGMLQYHCMHGLHKWPPFTTPCMHCGTWECRGVPVPAAAAAFNSHHTNKGMLRLLPHSAFAKHCRSSTPHIHQRGPDAVASCVSSCCRSSQTRACSGCCLWLRHIQPDDPLCPLAHIHCTLEPGVHGGTADPLHKGHEPCHEGQLVLLACPADEVDGWRTLAAGHMGACGPMWAHVGHVAHLGARGAKLALRVPPHVEQKHDSQVLPQRQTFCAGLAGSMCVQDRCMHRADAGPYRTQHTQRSLLPHVLAGC